MDSTEARILAIHNFDTSSLENLANDIANRFGCNVKFGYYENSEDQMGIVRVISAKDVTASLYGMSNVLDKRYDYVLEFGEEAKIIHNDFMEIMPPWDQPYDDILKVMQADTLDRISYYNTLFEECRKSGADKVYFIKDYSNLLFDANSQNLFKHYIEIFKSKFPYFEVKLF